MSAPIIWEDLLLHEEIGRGAFSRVYRATRVNGKVVAVKILHSAVLKNSQVARFQFIREAAYMATLKHPGLIEVYHLGEFQGEPYLVMEFIDGANLGQLLQESRRFEERLLLTYSKTLASILTEVHSHGIV